MNRATDVNNNAVLKGIITNLLANKMKKFASAVLIYTSTLNFDTNIEQIYYQPRLYNCDCVMQTALKCYC